MIFLEWLKNRIESTGYSVEDAPDCIKRALLSGDPAELAWNNSSDPSVWNDWANSRECIAHRRELMHRKSNGCYHGPRGGLYHVDYGYIRP